jgi:hypothetical protein
MIALGVDGIALFAPGLNGWEASLPILRGEQAYRAEPLAFPAPALLAPNERRRTSLSVRLALATADAAASAGGVPAASLASIFATSAGDGQVIHGILSTLAGAERQVSPTQFHNSVHNAAAGYWSIGTGSTQPSISIGAYDRTFAAGLIEAAAQIAARPEPLLLCVYDVPFPPPLAAARVISDSFAVALVLSPAATRPDHARLTLSLAARTRQDQGAVPATSGLAPLHDGNPAARALPLLEAIAQGRQTRLALPYLDDTMLGIDVTPCSTAPPSPG